MPAKTSSIPAPYKPDAADPVHRLIYWILARHAIYHKKEAGASKPWTTDPILSSYRFCNVYRELDTVTMWIAKHWRKPHEHDKDLWFAMVVARHLNLPDSMQELGYPVPYDPDRFIKRMHRRKGDGQKIFNGAYIVGTGGVAMDKIVYLDKYVLAPLWEARKELRPRSDDTLSNFAARMHEFPRMGTFMVGQVVADLKYVAPLDNARDWDTWAFSGPGSRRGMNRILQLPLKTKLKNRWYDELQILQARVNPILIEQGMLPLHAQDLQNCCCEWDKYERTRLGEGRPKRGYDGVA